MLVPDTQLLSLEDNGFDYGAVKEEEARALCLFKMRTADVSGSPGMESLKQPQNASLASLFLMHVCPLFVQGPHHILISPFLLGHL